jgi:hypothetical protein
MSHHSVSGGKGPPLEKINGLLKLCYQDIAVKTAWYWHKTATKTSGAEWKTWI